MKKEMKELLTRKEQMIGRIVTEEKNLMELKIGIAQIDARIENLLV